MSLATFSPLRTTFETTVKTEAKIFDSDAGLVLTPNVKLTVFRISGETRSQVLQRITAECFSE